MNHSVDATKYNVTGDAALMALANPNVVPTWEDVQSAKDALPALVEHMARIVADAPVVVGEYAADQPCFDQLRAGMFYEGWAYCGSGYYSTVFYRGGLALKIGIKPEDSGAAYALWCRANQGAAGVPIIHKMVAKGLVYGVLMDRLEPLAGELEEGSSSFDPHLAAEYNAILETVNGGRTSWDNHPLSTTALCIREFFADMANFDIHSHNVMLDRTGNLIITDPVSFIGDTKSEYYS